MSDNFGLSASTAALVKSYQTEGSTTDLTKPKATKLEGKTKVAQPDNFSELTLQLMSFADSGKKLVDLLDSLPSNATWCSISVTYNRVIKMLIELSTMSQVVLSYHIPK